MWALCYQFNPVGPMGKTPCFSAWVQSLGGELLSCMPQAWPKKKDATWTTGDPDPNETSLITECN